MTQTETAEFVSTLRRAFTSIQVRAHIRTACHVMCVRVAVWL